MKWEYLSDEELEKLVNEIEEKPLCRAPEYLESMILNKAKTYDRNVHRLSAGMQLFIYGVKIMAAAAAAIAVILTVPMMDKAQSLDYMEQSVQEEMDRMQNRAADRELTHLRDREENMARVNARRAMREEMERWTQQDWGNIFSLGGLLQQPEENEVTD